MNTKQKFLATLLGTSLTLAVIIPNRTLTNTREIITPQPNTQATTPTPTPDPDTTWTCPHEAQIKLTPTGQTDPVCAYRLGTIGSQIRTDMYEHYHSYRKLLIKEGKTPQEIERALYLTDLEIMKRVREGI